MEKIATPIEQWGIFEISESALVSDNPFTDVTFTAKFTQSETSLDVSGFYDGNDVFRLRFMPPQTGEWSYVTQSNHAALDGRTGSFTCVAPSAVNHGPVRVANTHHFAYADSTRHLSFGTTCYVWTHQTEALQLQTLETLRSAPFNKMRMCVFPKNYEYNRDDPPLYPFERNEDGSWAFDRFNPDFFQHFERRVGQLLELGIEADIILFTPYDNGKWGFDRMGAEADDRYLRYFVARLAAYRNVWWSMANEWDLCTEKTYEDWDRMGQIVQQSDPYGHLCSIHNWRTHYDHSKSWVTHLSVQNLHNYPDIEKVIDWREQYQKPVVLDESSYEGNLPFRWGFLPPQEMMHRFWFGTVLGGYAGHSESYLHPQDIIWWSKGGVLHGQSASRIAFLREVLEALPGEGLDPTTDVTRDMQCAGIPGEVYIAYGGRGQPAEARLNLPENQTYRADIIDAWEMTITPVEGMLTGKCRLPLPGKQFIALRLQHVG